MDALRRLGRAQAKRAGREAHAATGHGGGADSDDDDEGGAREGSSYFDRLWTAGKRVRRYHFTAAVMR